MSKIKNASVVILRYLNQPLPTMSATSMKKRKSSKISAAKVDAIVEEPKTKKRKLDSTPEIVQKLDKMQEDEEYNTFEHNTSSEQIDLPPEIIIQIFGQLSREDLAFAGQVSQHWWSCSKDESLAWSPLISYQLVEDYRTYSEAPDSLAKKGNLILQGSDTRLEYVEASRKANYGTDNANDATKVKFHVHVDEQQKWNSKIFVLLLDKNDKTVALTRLNKSVKVWIPDLTLDYYRYTLTRVPPVLKKRRIVPSELLKPNLPAQIQTEECYKLDIEVNLWKVEQLVREGKQPDCVEGLVRTAIAGMKNKFGVVSRKNYVQELFDPKKSYAPAALPIITEQPKELIVAKLHNYQINAINWMVTTEQESKRSSLSLSIDLKEIKLVLNDNTDALYLKFEPRGGILADEMGLGKTIEMLGLIMANPMKEAPECAPYFATKASLVLCPNHLAQQWKTEIEKHSSRQMNVIILSTIVQVKKFSYQDVIDADVVIVTYNLLLNNNYLAFPDKEKATKITQEKIQKRAERVIDVLEKRKDKAPNKIQGVILDHFHWHRIILDEGHESIQDLCIKEEISHLKRSFCWYMSGTPFPSVHSFNNVRELFGLAFAPIIDDDDHSVRTRHAKLGNWDAFRSKPVTQMNLENMLDRLLVDNLTWRNTKASISDEYKMVDTKQEVVLLNFTEIESAVYEDLNIRNSVIRHVNDPAREFCCKIDIKRGNTLEEIKEFTAKKKKNDIKRQKEQIEALHQRKKAMKEKLTTPNLPDYERRRTERFIAKFPSQLAAQEQLLQEHQRVKEIFDKFKSRKKLKFEEGTKEYLIEHYGTKLASLVEYLQTLFAKEPAARVIIFSQFSGYLDHVGKLLSENDISSSSVEGNVFKKTRALHKFKAEDSEVKVILLSLSKSASGTNLIEASHVLLMDPMTGTKEEAQAYEHQAIGRAQRQGQTKPVTVVRFIIKNTIEHEYYLRNTGTNANQQVSLKRGNSVLVRSGSFTLDPKLTLSNNGMASEDDD